MVLYWLLNKENHKELFPLLEFAWIIDMDLSNKPIVVDPIGCSQSLFQPPYPLPSLVQLWMTSDLALTNGVLTNAPREGFSHQLTTKRFVKRRRFLFPLPSMWNIDVICSWRCCSHSFYCSEDESHRLKMLDSEDGRSWYPTGILELHLPLTAPFWTRYSWKESKAHTYSSRFEVTFLFLAVEYTVSGLKSTQHHQIFSWRVIRIILPGWSSLIQLLLNHRLFIH